MLWILHYTFSNITIFITNIDSVTFVSYCLDHFILVLFKKKLQTVLKKKIGYNVNSIYNGITINKNKIIKYKVILKNSL